MSILRFEYREEVWSWNQSFMDTEGQLYLYIHKIRFKGKWIIWKNRIKATALKSPNFRHNANDLSKSGPEREPPAMTYVRMRYSPENSWYSRCCKGIPGRQLLLHDFQCDLYFRQKWSLNYLVKKFEGF